MGNSLKVVVFGSVCSSNLVLTTLIDAGVNIMRVYSLDEAKSANVSGYYPIHKTATEHGIPYTLFTKINDAAIIDEVKYLAPDYMFVVGLSQIISKELIGCAKGGAIGLHPAPLPKYRGRAAMVWQMILREKTSAVTMFFIDEGIDSGDIIVQEPFEIGDNDYAEDLDKKGLAALGRAMKKVARMISEGNVNRTPQDHSKATYLLMRRPEDGEIDWSQPIEDIHLLIRAVSRPFPGAFSYYDGKIKVVIWRADIQPNEKYIGMNGQIANVDDGSIDVVCNGGILHIYDYEIVDECHESYHKIIVGHKFKKQ